MKKEKQQIILNRVIEGTNWEAIAEMRKVASKAEGMNSDFLNNPTELKRLGTELLSSMLERGGVYYSSGMLTAFKTKHDEGLKEYGIRFEYGTTDASVYVEDGVVSTD